MLDILQVFSERRSVRTYMQRVLGKWINNTKD